MTRQAGRDSHFSGRSHPLVHMSLIPPSPGVTVRVQVIVASTRRTPNAPKTLSIHIAHPRHIMTEHSIVPFRIEFLRRLLHFTDQTLF